jgi:hypothetical protein
LCLREKPIWTPSFNSLPIKPRLATKQESGTHKFKNSDKDTTAAGQMWLSHHKTKAVKNNNQK